jgi:hypothetical protein
MNKKIHSLYLAIFFIAQAVLAYEIVLMRLLHIIQFAELSSVVISLALLGFGYSGVFCHYLKKQSQPHGFIITNVVLFTVLAPLSFYATQFLDFYSLSIVWDSSKLWKLFLWFSVLSIPFFLASNAIIYTLTSFKQEIKNLYCADLIGSGFGALLGVYFISFFPLEFIFAGVVLLSATSMTCFYYYFKNKIPYGFLFFAAAFIGSLAFVPIKISEYKALEKAKLIPGTQISEQILLPKYLVSITENSQQPLRYAPGLSFLYPGKIPEQIAVYLDANSFVAIDKQERLPAKHEPHYAKACLNYLVYGMQRPQENILKIGLSGYQKLSFISPTSVASIVEPQEAFKTISNNSKLGKYFSIYKDLDNLNFEFSPLETYLRDKEKKYSLIDLSMAGSSSTTASGISGVSTKYLSLEYISFLREHLDDRGILAIELWNTYPFFALERLFKTLEKKFGKEKIVVVKSLQTTLVLAKKTDFLLSDYQQINSFVKKHLFSLVYPQNSDYLPKFDTEQLLQTYGSEQVDKRWFETKPVSMDKPFFFKFMKLSAFYQWIYSGKEAISAHLLDVSYYHLLLSLLVAFLLSAFFILLPVAISRVFTKTKFYKHFFSSLYFFLLGLGFMSFEVALVQQVEVLLSHRVYAISFILFVFLLFSGLGSLCSDRFARLLPKSGYFFTPFLVATFGLLLIVFLQQNFFYLLSTTLLNKTLLLLLVLAPLCFFMGMPFVLGIKFFCKTDALLPWAWALGGFASVIGAVLAKVLCLELGFAVTLLFSTLIYLLAAVCAFLQNLLSSKR